MVQWKQIWLVSMRMQILSLASLSGIWHCLELWCGSQSWSGSLLAPAVAVIWPLAWELPNTTGLGEKNKKKRKERKEIMVVNSKLDMTHKKGRSWWNKSKVLFGKWKPFGGILQPKEKPIVFEIELVILKVQDWTWWPSFWDSEGIGDSIIVKWWEGGDFRKKQFIANC